MNGVGYLLRGLKLLPHPRVRPFVVVPLLLNFVLFGLGFYYLFDLMGFLQDKVEAWLPDLLSWLSFLVFPVVFVVALLLVFYTFTIIANILGSPFNGVLAERVEELAKGKPPVTTDAESWKAVIAGAPGAIFNELGKLLYMVKWMIIGSILTIIAMFSVVMAPMIPVILFMIAAWLLAVEYADYATDNNGLRASQSRALLKRQRFHAMGFGGAAVLMTWIPLLNLLAMPASVAGATLMWVEQLEGVWTQELASRES
ncbi:sulfate transporter CysZ [Magnetococcus sp. PR-3]|uniref:sulfate transporter CysZ n=1 Tax=Magnetococcus sp. PR-3 TaxID=3120355 RepID=UPI002FCE5166